MDKILYLGCIILLALWISIFTTVHPRQANALTDTFVIPISVIITGYIDLTIYSGSSINLGTLTPGTPVCNGSGTIARVTTNAANGYTLGLHDGSGTDSALVSSGTYIPDITAEGGGFTFPAPWVTGDSAYQGLGVTLFWASYNKDEDRWGTGTTACDGFNKWAGVPATTTVGHTDTGYNSSFRQTDWGWKTDVPNTQKTGSYSGDTTFTATAVFS